jgi:C4-dicarboxylate-specific signal transduction histidine kinase
MDKKHTGTHEEQKRALLRDGEFFRAGVAHARAQIKHAARPEVMFHTVIDHATWALRSRADTLLKPTGTSVTALAPYALTVLGFIRKRRLTKPALGIAALAGVAAWYVQRKRAQQMAY